jgi:hypothetical protein
MPDYRLIHRRALRGEKLATLTDFERGVWLAYVLIADDYGVMPFDAGELARAIWLKGKPHKAVQKALERVRDVGLIQTWTHQGAPYCYAHDWQEWQNVRHPRGTIEPCPPADVLLTCKPKTRELFAAHSRINEEIPPESFGKVSETLRNLPRLARAATRETLTLTQTLTANANPNARSKRPVYTSDRFAVFEWQLDELSKMLGSHFEAFELDVFFDALTQKSRADGLVIPRDEAWPWLQAQVLAEVKRRNLPVASATPVRDRAAEIRAQDERIFASLQEDRARQAESLAREKGRPHERH